MRERSTVCPCSRAICSTQSSTAESIPSPSRSIFRKPASAHESLSHWQSWRPFHRRGLHRHELDERPRRDHHPARVLRDVARQAADLAAEPGERAPARRRALGVGVRQLRQLLADAVRVAVGQAREPFELAERQSERLAHVADRAARVVGREARDERRVLAAVALADRDDQLLADVAREVEVDVRYRGELAVDEAAEREPGPHRVDVREAGQVADDRADRAAAPAARRQDVARDRTAAHLERALARELEHLPVEQEEPGEAELVDQLQLVVEPFARAALVRRSRRRSAPRRRGRRRRRAAGSPARRCRRSRGSGSRGPRSGRTRAARRARPCAPPRRGRAGSAPPTAPARAARSRGCRAAPARSRRARCGSGSRRARPGARCAADGARACRRSRRSGRRSPRRGRAAPRACGRPPARTGAAARRRTAPRPNARASAAAPFGLRVARPCRAQPERQTSPSFSSATSAASSDGGEGSAGRARVCACAAVSSRQRFA